MKKEKLKACHYPGYLLTYSNSSIIIMPNISRRLRLIKDNDYYKRQLNTHLTFIERQCLKALKIYKANFQSNLSVREENEAVGLFNDIVDKLKDRDYHVLKQYQGRSGLKCYLSAIISKEVVDLIRRKRGRKREKDSVSKLPVDKFEVVKNGYSPGDGEEKELIAVDNKNNPELNTVHLQSKKKVRQSLKTIVSGLNREERLLIRLRFPADEGEKPLNITEIARILAIKEKTVYTRLSRLLEKCRKQMREMGLSAKDYFFEENT